MQTGTKKDKMKTSGFVKHLIRNLDDLENLIPTMSNAESRRVHVEGLNEKAAMPVTTADGEGMYGVEYNDAYWYPGATSVVNMSTNNVAQITGPMYQILQHKDYFSAVVDLLRQKGFSGADGYAVESNGGNRWNVRLIFGDVTIDEPHRGANIRVGGEFSNSYDSFYAARGRAYYMRCSCQNQMVLANIIPECIFTRNHVAKSNFELLDIVTAQLEGFVTNLVKNKLKFKRKILDAISSEIEVANYQEMAEIMQEIFKVPVHSDAIAELAMKEAVKVTPSAKNFTIDRWEMYNSATFYVSHSDLTPNVVDTLLYRAENRILNTRRAIPIPVKA